MPALDEVQLVTMEPVPAGHDQQQDKHEARDNP